MTPGHGLRPRKTHGRQGLDQGFSLLEMAIVLVIVGGLVFAVLVGRGLIQNSQAKRLTSWVRGWENSIYAFVDRNGYLPGDLDRNGRLGNSPAEDPLQALANSGLQDLPAQQASFGSGPLAMYLGNNGRDPAKNALAIFGAQGPGTIAFGSGSQALFESLDQAIDGHNDPQSGLVRGYTSVGTQGNSTLTSLQDPADEYRQARAVAYYFAGAPRAGGVEYENDFTDPNDDSFTVWAGDWEVEDGEIKSDYGHVTFGPSLADLAISTTLNLGPDSSGGAIIYRAAGADNWLPASGYGFQVDTGVGGRFVLRGYNGNSESTLAEAWFPEGFDPYTEHQVQVAVSGDQHTFTVNGQQVLSYDGSNPDDPGYTSGQAGFRAWSGEAYFGPVLVETN